MKWWHGVLAIVLIVGGWWVVKQVTTPPPGVEVKDLGREHVTPEDVAKNVYSSNPPTSGSHLPTWINPGIYDTPQTVGELLHSLEHGYVEIHYNCNPVAKDSNKGKPAGQLQAAPGGAISDSNACKTLVKNLGNLAKSKKLWKLIVTPNPTIDSTIVLAAWDHIEPLNSFDAQRIIAFIDYYRDHGPERTME